MAGKARGDPITSSHGGLAAQSPKPTAILRRFCSHVSGSGVSIPDRQTQVLPRLSLTVVFTRTEKKGGQLLRRLTLRVTDAGDPVAGASVTVAGRTLRTTANGKASGLFPSTGKQAGAKATKAGYAVATTRVRL